MKTRAIKSAADMRSENNFYQNVKTCFDRWLELNKHKYDYLDETDFDTIVDDAVTKAWRGRNTFDPNKSFEGWVYTIIHNCAVTYAKKCEMDMGRCIALDEFFCVDDSTEVMYDNENDFADDTMSCNGDSVFFNDDRVRDCRIAIEKFLSEKEVFLFDLLLKDYCPEALARELHCKESDANLRKCRLKSKIERIVNTMYGWNGTMRVAKEFPGYDCDPFAETALSNCA